MLESFADFSSLNAQNNVASNKEETNNAASSKDSSKFGDLNTAILINTLAIYKKNVFRK